MTRRGFALVLAWACVCLVQANGLHAAVAQDVSYCDLARTPAQFSGKRVSVRAIYRYGFEVQSLDPPGCCPERAGKIWLEMDPKLGRGTLNLLHKFPKGMGLVLATFTGTLETGGPYGDGGYRSKFEIDRVEKIEATSKVHSGREPSWIPQNCADQKNTSVLPVPPYPKLAQPILMTRVPPADQER